MFSRFHINFVSYLISFTIRAGIWNSCNRRYLVVDHKTSLQAIQQTKWLCKYITSSKHFLPM